MFFYISTFIFGLTVYALYRKKEIISTVISVGFDYFLKKLARKYNLITGEKFVMDNCDVAKISYVNVSGHPCFIQVPFLKNQVRVRKTFKVILLKETEEKGLEKFDITHEPGVPYFLSAHDLGGKELQIYKSESWKDEGVFGEPILIVKGKNLLPEDWKSLKKEDDVLF